MSEKQAGHPYRDPAEVVREALVRSPDSSLEQTAKKLAATRRLIDGMLGLPLARGVAERIAEVCDEARVQIRSEKIELRNRALTAGGVGVGLALAVFSALKMPHGLWAIAALIPVAVYVHVCRTAADHHDALEADVAKMLEDVRAWARSLPVDEARMREIATGIRVDASTSGTPSETDELPEGRPERRIPAKGRRR